MNEVKSDQSESEGEGSEENEDEVPFENKVQFTEKVRRLTNDGLTKLVKNVKSICPDALDDADAEKLYIQVDKLDKASFDQLEKIVEQNLVKKGGTKNEQQPKKMKNE